MPILLFILKIIGWVLLSILLLFFLLSLIPVGVLASYKEELVVKIQYGFVKLTLYPEEPKKKRWWSRKKKRPPEDSSQPPPSPHTAALDPQSPKAPDSSEERSQGKAPSATLKESEKKKTKNKKDGKEAKEKEKKTLKEQIEALLPLLPSSKKALNTIRKHIVIDKIRVHMHLSGENAHATGELFGRMNILVTQVFSLLNEFFILRLQELHLVPDFLSDKSSYDLHIRVRLRPIWLLKGAFHLLIAFLRINRKNKREQKGGTYYERKTTTR